MLCDYNSLNADHLLKTPIPAAAHEQLTQVLNDDQLASTDALLNITKRQSCLHPASRCAGYLKFFIQIVGFEIIDIFVVPLFTLSTMPFPLTLLITTGLLPIFKSWMGYKPPFAYPARTFACEAPGHRFPSC
jgi:hypothetical protein